MKRILTAIIAIWSVTTMAGLPPTVLKGEASSSSPTTFNFKVPNYQATQTNGINSRIETGNSNLLANPSYESATASTSWTLTNATGADDTTHKTDGLKGIAVTVTSTGGGIKQTSTINASYLAGSQGMVKVSVYTTGTDVHVCPLLNGARPSDTTKYCALVPKSTTSVPMPEVIVPFIMDGTSNGIEIYSDSTTAFTVDEAFVGKAAPFQSVSGAKLLGTVTITGCAAFWSTTSTGYVDFSAQTGCTYLVTGQAQAPSTMIPALKFASVPAGEIRLEYEGTFGSNVQGMASYFQFSDGTNSARETSSAYAGSSSSYTNSMSQSLTYSTTQSNVTFSIKGKTDATGTARISGTTLNPGTIKVWYFPPESRIYSQNYKTVTAQVMVPAATTACGTATPAPFSVVNFDTTSSYNNSTYTYTVPVAGYYDINANDIFFSGTDYLSVYKNGAKLATLVYGNATYILSGYTGAYFSVGDLITFRCNANPNILYSAGNYQAKITIAKRDADQIVGSFAGIEKCANDYECTDTFSAQVSATGVVSGENVEWVNGNASIANTSEYTLTYQTYLKDGINALGSTMNCEATAFDTNSNNNIQIISQSSTGITVKTAGNGSVNARAFTLKCQKASPDFKPKTAKIASSIGVPTVPGITTTGTGNAIDTFSFSYGATVATPCTTSPCPYLDQIGTVVSSVTRTAAGTYTVNLTKTYSKLKCVGNSIGAGVQSVDNAYCTSCSSVPINSRVTSVGPQDSYGIIYCQGSY